MSKIARVNSCISSSYTCRPQIVSGISCATEFCMQIRSLRSLLHRLVSTSDADNDSLALVNSFYGPGATACWYLTCLSCLISWTLHPKKKGSDSITSGFIAVLTFPTVAAAHLVTQVQGYPSESLEDQLSKQIHASISASLIITETYLNLCIILLVPSLLVRSFNRILLLAATGFFCVAAETYLFFAVPSIRNKTRIFNRSFIVNSVPLLTLVLVIVPVLAALLSYFIYLRLLHRGPPPRAEPPPGASSEILGHYRRVNRAYDVRVDLCIARLTLVGLVLLPFSSVCSTLPPATDLFWLVGEARNTVNNFRARVIGEFFPPSNTSIMELDQAVALLAGMTVLGFCLYSVTDERYRRWLEAEAETESLNADARQMTQNPYSEHEWA